ncbi:MAG TPA: hypothetical protein VF898_00720 [Chloroflexota bacterium]
MTLKRVTRDLIGATLVGVAFLLVSPIFGQTPDVQTAAAASPRATSNGQYGAQSQISLQVAVGYQNIYRGSSWTPVRVSLHNSSNVDVTGTLQIPQSDQSTSVGTTPTFHGLYEAPVTLPAGGTKHVTIYVPGAGIQGHVDVTFHEEKNVVATGTAFPIGIDTSALLIGSLASSPGDTSWLASTIQQQVTTHVVRLTTATLDPLAQALNAFDIIVLSNVDTSQLDHAQVSALEAYVLNGGSLLLVGGPTWQQTLRPLPAALLPGKLVGTRVLPNLDRLRSLGSFPRSAGTQAFAVSVLTKPSGVVRAGQAGVPLVVRKLEGKGVVEYLAFDPALSPVSTGSPLLAHLVAMAAPVAITRTWSPQGFRARFEAIFRAVALTNELANVPAARLPLLAIFAALTLAYVVILGPANFLILRRIGRQHIAWITIPVLALIYVGSVFGIANHLKPNAALLNSIGIVTLGGSAGQQPATFYVSLAAPLPGTYQLTYASAALPASLPQVKSPSGFFPRNASTLQSTPLGLRLQEDPQTRVTFLAMQNWATRDLTLDTSVHIPGSVQSNLRIDAHGDVAGSIHNGTNLELRNPVIVAGQAIAHLPDIPAGATVQARVHPNSDTGGQDPTSFWSNLYGGPELNPSDAFGAFGFRDCCNQVSFPKETRLIDRMRNVIAMLSQAQALTSPGTVLLVGWSDRPLGTFTIDGVTPQRRDLNLIMTPLAVRFPSHGSFQLTDGTLAAHLVDIVPRAPQSCCFGFGGPDTPQQLSVGTGGSLTFEFDLPGSRHIHFQHLVLSTFGGEDSLGPARVYDWHTLRWIPINLSSGSFQFSAPNDFVSPGGQILVEIRATTGSGDITISDQYHALDLSGNGTVT